MDYQLSYLVVGFHNVIKSCCYYTERSNGMKIMEFIDEGAVCCELRGDTKEHVIRELIGLLVKTGSIKEKDVPKLVRILLEREALGSTGIGQGVAIPHGKSDCVSQLVGALGICHHGVNFDSLDGGLTHLFFLLVAPEDSAADHLKALARIARLLKDPAFRARLMKGKTSAEIFNAIREEDEKF